jgi:hypothetical protein
MSFLIHNRSAPSLETCQPTMCKVNSWMTEAGRETMSREAGARGKPGAEAPSPRELFTGYDESRDQPLGAYAGLAGIFGALFALFLVLVRWTGRPLPERVGAADLVLLGVATHKLSWILANSSVTSFLRAPVTHLEEAKSPTNLDEKPRGEGLQKALGSLLTCHFCLGMWTAAFFSYGLVFAPRATRFLAGILSILALSDFTHQAYKATVERAPKSK